MTDDAQMLKAAGSYILKHAVSKYQKPGIGTAWDRIGGLAGLTGKTLRLAAKPPIAVLKGVKRVVLPGGAVTRGAKTLAKDIVTATKKNPVGMAVPLVFAAGAFGTEKQLGAAYPILSERPRLEAATKKKKSPAKNYKKGYYGA